MAPRNLVPGQYQLGDVIFGRGTNIRCQSFEVMPYDVQNQDHQVSRADRKRFGFDQLTPTTINIKFGVLRNYIRENSFNPTGVTNAIFADFPGVKDLRREWRDPFVRRVFGQQKPLYVCGLTDGITRMVWGRPGQFTYARPNRQTEWLECLGEFRTSDVLSYDTREMVIALHNGNGYENVIDGTGGDAETYLRILFFGPCTNPRVTIGEVEIGFDDLIIPSGKAAEINAYPWNSYAINNDNPPLNLSSKLVGPYLDKLFFRHDAVLPVEFSATGTTTATAAAVCFHDAYELID